MEIYEGEYDRPLVLEPCETPEQRAAVWEKYLAAKRKGQKMYEENKNRK